MSGTSIFANLLLKTPWPEVLVNAWKYGSRLFRGLAHEGMYEILEKEISLELLDKEGKKARFKKRIKVRYSQDNITTFQDYAWGDGEIFQSYRCSPGKPVDRYRLDYKTYILISLREVKSRGEVDEFNIQWNINDGFLRRDESWASDITDRTKHLSMSVIFPKDCRVTKLALVESNQRRYRELDLSHKVRLPDGRLKVTWEKNNPRLYETYLIKWHW